MSFTVGQRVTVLAGYRGEPERITTVRAITHRGTQIRLAGSDVVYRSSGFSGGYNGNRIVPSTPEHEEHIRRAELWRSIDAAIYPTSAEQRESARSKISTPTLEEIARLCKVAL